MFDTSHIHPMLVHFPIALTLLGVLLEAVALWRKKQVLGCRCGEILLYFGTVAAVVAAIAGGLFTPNFTEPLLAQAKNIHSAFAGATITLLCLSSVVYISRYIFKTYSSILHRVGFGLYVLSALSVAVTGYLGGVLVYNDLLKM